MKDGRGWYKPDGTFQSERGARMDIGTREDGLRVERMCKHGVGHPVGTTRPITEREQWVWVHG